ncbi:MAG: hypothetical protein Q4F95_02290 [Oscillospiraceae bacterium]|nr:hypothetical protein [Oscillospiraceae bacterium]
MDNNESNRSNNSPLPKGVKVIAVQKDISPYSYTRPYLSDYERVSEVPLEIKNCHIKCDLTKDTPTVTINGNADVSVDDIENFVHYRDFDGKLISQMRWTDGTVTRCVYSSPYIPNKKIADDLQWSGFAICIAKKMMGNGNELCELYNDLKTKTITKKKEEEEKLKLINELEKKKALIDLQLRDLRA